MHWRENSSAQLFRLFFMIFLYFQIAVWWKYSLQITSFILFLLQLDFQLPLRFNLSYSAEDEAKRERPVMIHRAILGSVERMFAILLEHYKGKWPFWLSPRQAIVCPVSDKSQPYALEVNSLISSKRIMGHFNFKIWLKIKNHNFWLILYQVKDMIHKAGYYVEVDISDRKIQKKVSTFLQSIPWAIDYVICLLYCLIIWMFPDKRSTASTTQLYIGSWWGGN